MSVFLPFPSILALMIVGIVFLVLGLTRAYKTYVGIGGTLIGLSLLALVLVYVAYDASTPPFSPSIGYLLLFGSLIFLSGMFVAFGLHQLATRSAS